MREDRLRLEIGKLPTMRIIAIDSLLLHEDPDPERARPLTRRMAADGCLRNPPIAAKDHGAASHILLDGANRVEALRQLGARHLVVQEVDLADDHLVLSTWHHALEGLNAGRMLKELGEVTPIRPHRGKFTRDGDFVPPLVQAVACFIVLPDRRVFAAIDGKTPGSRLEVTRRVVAATLTASNRDRVSYTNLADLATNYPHFSALLCYKGFSKTEVLELALGGKRFPSGVTRFKVPKRALSLAIPLELLRRRTPLAAKQRELEQMVRRAIEAKRIRFYEEPTFYFDD